MNDRHFWNIKENIAGVANDGELDEKFLDLGWFTVSGYINFAFIKEVE